MPAFRRVVRDARRGLGERARDEVSSRPTRWSAAVRRGADASPIRARPAARRRRASDRRRARASGVVVAGLAAGFDPEWGGFGPAPKFPRPTLVELCLRRAPARGIGRRGRRPRGPAHGPAHPRRHGGRRHLRPPRRAASAATPPTRRWLVPHFEKMLTDQALLARAYLHAWQVTGTRRLPGRGRPRPSTGCSATSSTPEGGLYSSFDADAGGVEGGHATFTLDEVRRLLAGRRLVGPARRVVRGHRGRELGGAHHPGPPRRRTPGPPARDRRGPARSWPSPGRRRPAGP